MCNIDFIFMMKNFNIQDSKAEIGIYIDMSFRRRSEANSSVLSHPKRVQKVNLTTKLYSSYLLFQHLSVLKNV